MRWEAVESSGLAPEEVALEGEAATRHVLPPHLRGGVRKTHVGRKEGDIPLHKQALPLHSGDVRDRCDGVIMGRDQDNT